MDGRDPFFFRCLDLEHYVKEVDPSKLNLLLINKSDLLSPEIRAHWNAYLLKKNIPHLFFSAKEEQQKIDLTPNVEKNEEEKLQEVKSTEHKTEELLVESKEKKSIQEVKPTEHKNEELLEESKEKKPIKNADNQIEINLAQSISLANSPNLVSRQTLLSTLKFLVQTLVIPEKNKEKHNEIPSKHKLNPENQILNLKIPNDTQAKPEVSPNIVTIGMVGYPNVGKSSIINVLCGKKLVGVASRPGKTKHFQTIFLEKELILCDCPGLVFPSANSNRSEMVCNGVLPIDNVKDYISPIELLARKIEKKVFEKVYNVKLESFGLREEESGKEQTEYTIGTHVLTTIARKRGFFTGGSGLPDQAKVAKMVLKDFVNGRLIYCKLNPEYSLQVEGKIKGINGYIEAQDESHDAKKNEIKILEEVGGRRKEEGSKKRVEEQLDNFFREERGGEAKEELDEEDVMDLLEGKVVKGVKLNKMMRREIKFALKRGEVKTFF